MLLALLCVQPRALLQDNDSAALQAVMAVDTAADNDERDDQVDDDVSAWSGLPDLPDDTHDLALSTWHPQAVLHGLSHAAGPARFDAHVDTLLRPPSA